MIIFVMEQKNLTVENTQQVTVKQCKESENSQIAWAKEEVRNCISSPESWSERETRLKWCKQAVTGDQEQSNGPNNKLLVWWGKQQGTAISVQKTEEEQQVRWYMDKVGLREWEQEIMSTEYTEIGWINGLGTNFNMHGYVF